MNLLNYWYLLIKSALLQLIAEKISEKECEKERNNGGELPWKRKNLKDSM